MSTNAAPYVSDLEFNQQECIALQAQWRDDADTLDEDPTSFVSGRIPGECRFTSKRHRLVGDMFGLLFSENIDRDDDPKALVITVPQDSPTTVDESFKPLEYGAATRFGATGFWQGMTEDNYLYEILFYDSPDGGVSDRLVSTAQELGEQFSPTPSRTDDDRPGEYVLLATIEDIENTSLEVADTESAFPSEQLRNNMRNISALRR